MQRALDEQYRGFDREERGRFRRLVLRCATHAAKDIVEGKVKNKAIATAQLAQAIDCVDAMYDRDWKRVEPFVKMAANLSEERPTVQILIGQRATSPAMRMLTGADKHVIEAKSEGSEESTEDSHELPTPDRDR